MMDLELHEKNTVPNSLARSNEAKNKGNINNIKKNSVQKIKKGRDITA